MLCVGCRPSAKSILDKYDANHYTFDDFDLRFSYACYAFTPDRVWVDGEKTNMFLELFENVNNSIETQNESRNNIETIKFRQLKFSKFGNHSRLSETLKEISKLKKPMAFHVLIKSKEEYTVLLIQNMDYLDSAKDIKQKNLGVLRIKDGDKFLMDYIIQSDGNELSNEYINKHFKEVKDSVEIIKKRIVLNPPIRTFCNSDLLDTYYFVMVDNNNKIDTVEYKIDSNIITPESPYHIVR